MEVRNDRRVMLIDDRNSISGSTAGMSLEPDFARMKRAMELKAQQSPSVDALNGLTDVNSILKHIRQGG